VTDDRKDARLRAIRSLTWGLFLDVSTAVILVLMTAFTALEWTRQYWVTLGLLLAKSILQAVVAFFARLLIPPKTG
jgi:hypothetical protein